MKRALSTGCLSFVVVLLVSSPLGYLMGKRLSTGLTRPTLLVPVVVMVADVPTGMPLEGAHLGELPIPSKFVHEGMIQSADAPSLIGQRLTVPVLQGQALTRAHLAIPSTASQIDECVAHLVSFHTNEPAVAAGYFERMHLKARR